MKRVLSILSNILNKNNNNLLTLSIDYITYFYYYYSQLLKTFPNLFSKSFITLVHNLKNYICCSLTRFKCYIRYLISFIYSTLTSHSSKIQSLTRLIPEFKGLINNVFCNLRSAITLNITLVCLKISKIDNSIKCFNKEIHGAVDMINCVIALICKCKSSIIESLENCLKQIKSKLIGLHPIFLKLGDKFGEISYLKKETQKIISCNNDISCLKDKICKLVESFNCSLKQFKCIECQIKCIKCIISQIKEKKQELCKQIDKFLFYICINIEFTWSLFPFNISSLTKESLQKNIKCLSGKIEKICSEFTTIENNTAMLKHSLMFNEMYFKISSTILEQLQSIQSIAESINPKIGDLNAVPSGITLISDNVNYVKSMIEGINEGANDLAYLRDTMKYIMPKLCEIKEKAKCIIGVECVVKPLNKIKCSIDNLKEIEYDQKCLEILECYDGISIKTVTCITDNLNIKCITAKLDTVQNGISSLESVIWNIKNLLGCVEIIENILSVIDYLKRNISKLANKFIRCSLESLSTHIINLSSDNNNRLNNSKVGLEMNNTVMSMYSVMSVMDYRGLS